MGDIADLMEDQMELDMTDLEWDERMWKHINMNSAEKERAYTGGVVPIPPFEFIPASPVEWIEVTCDSNERIALPTRDIISICEEDQKTVIFFKRKPLDPVAYDTPYEEVAKQLGLRPSVFHG